MKTYSIREVLQQIEHMPDAWFYLPDTEWTLTAVTRMNNVCVGSQAVTPWA